MLTELEARKIIQKIIKRSFFEYFIDKKEPDTQHILLAKLFPEEMRKSSIIQGLQTSLGTTLWEKIAKEFAISSGFTILNPKDQLLRPNPIPKQISDLVEKFRVNREAPNSKITLLDFSGELNNVIKNLKIDKNLKFEKLIKGSGADILISDEKHEYAFDLKTVQINAGSGPKFNQTFLYWIAFRTLYNHTHGFPQKEFKALLAIPYDPYINSTWWTHMRGRAYPLNNKDILVGNDFWNFLAKNTHAGDWLNQEINLLQEGDFSLIYRDLLSSNNLNKKLNLITSQLKVSHISKLTSNLQLDSKLSWSCMSCGFNFEKKSTGLKKIMRA